MEIKIGALEGESVDRRTRIDILTDEEEKIRVEREELEMEKQRKDVGDIFVNSIAKYLLSHFAICFIPASYSFSLVIY